jgi:hypothetical protein
MITAAELLNSPNCNSPIVIAFRNHLGGKEATKRKAREFLHTFGAQYGLRPRKPIYRTPEEKKQCQMPIHIGGSTMKILREIMGKK